MPRLDEVAISAVHKPIAAFKLAFCPVLVARVVVQSIASVR